VGDSNGGGRLGDRDLKERKRKKKKTRFVTGNSIGMMHDDFSLPTFVQQLCHIQNFSPHHQFYLIYRNLKIKRGKKCVSYTLGTRRKHKHTHGQHCPSLTQSVSPAGRAVPPVAVRTQQPPNSWHKHAAGAYSSDISSVQPP